MSTNCQSVVNQLSINCQSIVTNCQPIVNQLWTNCQLLSPNKFQKSYNQQWPKFQIFKILFSISQMVGQVKKLLSIKSLIVTHFPNIWSQNLKCFKKVQFCSYIMGIFWCHDIYLYRSICSKSKGKEERELNTLILLATTPPHQNSIKIQRPTINVRTSLNHLLTIGSEIIFPLSLWQSVCLSELLQCYFYIHTYIQVKPLYRKIWYLLWFLFSQFRLCQDFAVEFTMKNPLFLGGRIQLYKLPWV